MLALRLLKWLAVFVIVLAGIWFWSAHTYHPGRLVAIAAGRESAPQKVVRAAASLQGVLYDYSAGRLSRLGLLVCADVPRLAYRAAGIDLGRLMARDWHRHPEHYPRFAGNNPSTPYFARRVADQKVFFADTGRLIKDCRTPEPGDTVFYGDSHVTMVLAVYPDHTYDEMETAPWTVFATIHRHKAWVPRDVGRFRRLQGM